jgi:raffinose/stachyose/melibiose transport system permease protein
MNRVLDTHDGARARRPLRRPRAATVTKIAMVAPAMTLFLVFYVASIVAGIVLSFYHWDGLDPIRFVGFENYRVLFSDPVFVTNVKVTLVVVGACLVCILPLALLLAVCLSGPGRLLPLFRWIVFVPVVLPLAAVALLWAEIFNPVGGLANQLVGKLGISPVAWLGDQRVTVWALVLVSIWSILGLHVVIQLSALSAIPTELKEAARLETPSVWRVFRHVVLPLMRDSLTVSAALIITGTFVGFTSLAFVMTRGGPVHSTEVLGLRAYLEGFASLNFGMASAITVITMLLTIVLVGVTLFIGSRRRIEY